MIAALYTQTDGIYYGLPGVDPWDESRDARLYAGPHPVVAHPPCARWCRLAGLVEARYPHLRKGEDGGTFASALSAVRKFGGVLEHPAYSDAWAAFELVTPRQGRWLQGPDGCWVTQVSQRSYGHRARKMTWLLANVPDPPALDWSKPPPAETWLSWCANNGDAFAKRMSKKEGNATPLPFRDLLISIAASAVRT